MIKSKKPFYSIFTRFWFAARMAMQGVLANPLRSALTILGVAIGVASVVSLMGIGEGARKAVVEQFKSLGSNVIAIQAQNESAEFEPEYAYELIDRVQGLESATPVAYAKAVMKWRRIRGNVEIIGVNSNYPGIRDHKVQVGRFFNELHVKQRSQVAVIGYNLAISLSKGRNLVGSSLTLNGKTYSIIGIMSEKGSGNAEGVDDKILIPYTSALKISESKTVKDIWGKAASKVDTDLAVVQLSRIIKTRLGLRKNAPTYGGPTGGDPGTGAADGGGGGEVAGGGKDEPIPEQIPDQPAPDPGDGGVPKPEISGVGDDLVTITSLNQLVKEADNTNRVMTLLLGGIAAVSLLVGGLGIMNIMMVAVSERTEEIGVRRALGAKQGDLLFQFMLEALYVSLFGSIAGIAAGIWGLGIFNGIGYDTAINFQAIKIATVVALASGLLFGVYPAVSASALPPVEALRR
ncbi:MAG: FtsX-like permease family protein [Ruminiclostridium sp.]|nr:FtsX-like permease family protein [Ruminiclostridium sp.]